MSICCIKPAVAHVWRQPRWKMTMATLLQMKKNALRWQEVWGWHVQALKIITFIFYLFLCLFMYRFPLCFPFTIYILNVFLYFWVYLLKLFIWSEMGTWTWVELWMSVAYSDLTQGFHLLTDYFATKVLLNLWKKAPFSMSLHQECSWHLIANWSNRYKTVYLYILCQ